MEQVGQNVFKLRQKVAKKLEKISERLDNTEENAGQEEVISRREFGKMLGLGSAAGAGALMFSDAARAATTVDPDFLSLDDGGDLRFGNGNDFELRYDATNSQLELVGSSPVWTVSQGGSLNIKNRDLDLGSQNITGVGNVDGVDISSHVDNNSVHHSKTTSLSELNDVTGVEAFDRNTSGNRPSAGTQGRIYFETDTGRVLYDNGASWIEIGVTTHNQLDTIGTEDHHSPGAHMEKNGTDFDVTPSTIDATNLDGSSGTSGQVLQTDGSNLSWGSAGGNKVSFIRGYTMYGDSSVSGKRDLWEYQLGSGESFQLQKIELGIKGASDNSNFVVEVYDSTNDTILGSTSDNVSGNPIAESGSGAKIIVRYENTTGSSQPVSINVEGKKG